MRFWQSIREGGFRRRYSTKNRKAGTTYHSPGRDGSRWHTPPVSRVSFAVVPIIYIYMHDRYEGEVKVSPRPSQRDACRESNPPPPPVPTFPFSRYMIFRTLLPKSPSVREQFVLELQRIRPGESLFPHGTEEHAPQRRRGFPPPRVGVVPPPHHDRHRSHRPRAGRVDERIVRDGGDDDRRRVAR